MPPNPQAKLFNTSILLKSKNFCRRPQLYVKTIHATLNSATSKEKEALVLECLTEASVLASFFLNRIRLCVQIVT